MAPRILRCLLALPLALCGCASDDEESTSGTGASTTDGESATSVMTAGSTGAGTTAVSESGGGSSGSAETSASGGSGPKLDIGDSGGSASASGGDGMTSIYESCQETVDCVDGLECLTIGLGEDLLRNQCTIGCSDSSDCPDSPGAEVGCLEGPLGGGPQCTIVCDAEGECPSGYTCWNAAIELAPCVP